MNTGDYDLFARRLVGALLVVAVAYSALQIGLAPAAFLDSLVLLLVLSAGAILAARASHPAGDCASSGFALAFVLPAPVLLPVPGALLVALCAALAGPRRVSPPHLAASAVVFAIAQFFAEAWIQPEQAASPLTLVALGLLFVTVHAFGAALDLALGPDERERRGPVRARWKNLALDALSVPLAWILTSSIATGAWLQAATIAAIALFGAAIRSQLDRTVTDLRSKQSALDSRVTELATLHAIGREIASSLEPGRVFSLVERECRKIFRVDHCCIALTEVDGNALRTVYRRSRGHSADTAEEPLSADLWGWATDEKRSVRLDDLEAPEAADLPVRELAADGTGSIMIVPLIIEDRLIGLLSLQSREPGAYDDHQVSVLVTIAQQAAVAIENAKHYQQATIDSMTGFHSRDYFFGRVAEEHRRVVRYGGGFALLMMDLDGFKTLNDRHGHLAADHYLREITEAVRGHLREADLPCRYGGDEFCILLPETDLEGGRTIAERIRSAVSGRIVEAEGAVLRTTASIGLAVFPHHGDDDVHDLLRKADQALYLAKRQGRDRVVTFAAAKRSELGGSVRPVDRSEDTLHGASGAPLKSLGQ
jgi:diguanylate cyclase (GGDEF)-like protein